LLRLFIWLAIALVLGALVEGCGSGTVTTSETVVTVHPAAPSNSTAATTNPAQASAATKTNTASTGATRTDSGSAAATAQALASRIPSGPAGRTNPTTATPGPSGAGRVRSTAPSHGGVLGLRLAKLCARLKQPGSLSARQITSLKTVCKALGGG
jgi:hypothetical protein